MKIATCSTCFLYLTDQLQVLDINTALTLLVTNPRFLAFFSLSGVFLGVFLSQVEGLRARTVYYYCIVSQLFVPL